MAPDMGREVRICRDPLNAAVSISGFEHVKSVYPKTLSSIYKLVVGNWRESSTLHFVSLGDTIEIEATGRSQINNPSYSSFHSDPGRDRNLEERYIGFKGSDLEERYMYLFSMDRNDLSAGA